MNQRTMIIAILHFRINNKYFLSL